MGSDFHGFTGGIRPEAEPCQSITPNKKELAMQGLTHLDAMSTAKEQLDATHGHSLTMSMACLAFLFARGCFATAGSPFPADAWTHLRRLPHFERGYRRSSLQFKKSICDSQKELLIPDSSPLEDLTVGRLLLPCQSFTGSAGGKSPASFAASPATLVFLGQVFQHQYTPS